MKTSMKTSQSDLEVSASLSPLTDDEKTLIQANLRLKVDERMRRHDAALNTLNELRTLVRAGKRMAETPDCE